MVSEHASPKVVPPTAPRRRRAGAHRKTPPHGLQGNAAVVALAAGAAISAASAGGAAAAQPTESGENVILLATDDPATAADPAPARAAEATPSAPVAGSIAESDAEGGVEGTFADVLHTGTQLNEQREIAEEEARRPQVALPAVGSFTSGFGPRWGSFHAGIDIANAIGTPIYAATDGVVIDSGPASGYGNWIRVMSPDGVMTVYGHQEANHVEVGDRVMAGQQIGEMGNRGFSTGPHLHFEVWLDDGGRVVDPLPWLAENGITLDGGTSSLAEAAEAVLD